MTARAAFAGILTLLSIARSGAAQTEPLRVQAESRIDVVAARWTAVQGAVGLTVPSGLYVRSGLIVGAGGGGRGFDSRADLISRFNLDPFRQSPWAPYAGGGLSERYAASAAPRAHAYLLGFVGLEGPLSGSGAAGWAPAFELGLGGGARISLIIRRGIRGRR